MKKLIIILILLGVTLSVVYRSEITEFVTKTFLNQPTIIKGTYSNTESAIYKSFIFKGDATVVVIDNLIGFPFVTSYTIDGDLLRIRTDKSDLLLIIQDENTLVGEGFAKGTYRKDEN